ncbi:MAG: DUF2169 domain-containing protein [Pseudomonadota bacterium]
MKLSTQFPLATLFFKHWSTDDTECGVVIAKASFNRDANRWVADDNPVLELEDTFAGDPGCTPLVQEQDIAPGKVGTDLIVHAVARSPDAALLGDWPVSLTIEDRLHYDFQVRGPSRWSKGPRGKWTRTPPELVSEIPITYNLAYGGTTTGPDGEVETYQNNPSGCGHVTPHHLSEQTEFNAPQIGLLAEFMSPDPLAEMSVHGFGPIAKFWLPRRGHAGTFDQTWKTTRHPRMPKDYALTFWNAAPAPLQCDPPLRGNEIVSVGGVSHSGPVRLKLPSVACALHLGPDGAHPQKMVLDTVTLDLRSADPSDYRVDLVWRLWLATPDRFQSAEIAGYALED